MGHEYNEMIDVLSESINLTESIPMPREGLLEDFEPIFAEEYTPIYNPSFDQYPLMNPNVLNLGVNRRNYIRNENPSNQVCTRRNYRRFHTLAPRNIVFCSRERSRPDNFLPTQINLTNSAQIQSNNSNNIQIELSSDSGEETELYRQRNTINRECRRREFNFRNKIKRNINTRQPTVVVNQTEVNQNTENSSSRGTSVVRYSNTGQYLPTATNQESNDTECDCIQCLPVSGNQPQDTRRFRERNRICKRDRKECVPLPSSSHTNSIEPLPGPSGIPSNSGSVAHQTLDSSDSENDVTPTTNNQRTQSDVLTAPELQLDCFSDSSNDSDNDVIEINTPSASSTSGDINVNGENSNISHEVTQSRQVFHRNRGYESGGSQSNTPLRPLITINSQGPSLDINRCPYNQNYQYSQPQRNNYCSNNRYYPDARAPNAPDFGRNSVFNSNVNFNSNGSPNNFIGHNRSFGRWTNRNDNHYRRRFYNNAPRPSTYIPHQRLWQQQNLVQEVYRRFMSNNYDEFSRQYNNHGLSVNSPHWQRREYPAYPHMRLFHSGLQDDDFSTMYVPSIRRYPSRGASQEIIESNTVLYKFSAINENFDNEKCSICLSPFEVDTCVRRLPCLHVYHRECIEQWLQLNSTCPICRIDIQKTRNI